MCGSFLGHFSLFYCQFIYPWSNIQRRKWQPCLENSVDGGAWWAAVHGIAQSQTWLKRLSMHACIGGGNGNPLQCSCLENARDGGAWWAAVYGVAESRTRLKRLSSSSRETVLVRKQFQICLSYCSHLYWFSVVYTLSKHNFWMTGKSLNLM